MKCLMDAKHHLIVAHEVTGVGHDRNPRSSMARQACSACNAKSLAWWRIAQLAGRSDFCVREQLKFRQVHL
jgi:hypothetical protein